MSLCDTKKWMLGLTAISVIAVILGGCVSPQERWEKARSIDTVEAYREIFESDPNTEYSTKAAQRIAEIEAERDWIAAQEMGTIAGYEMVIRNHPNSEQAYRARARIDEIQERRDWQHALEKDEESFYLIFLLKHPGSENAHSAQVRIDEIREQSAWQQAKEMDTEFAYGDFLESYPDSSHAEEARANLNRLRALPHWERAQQIDTIGAYEDFINEYPDTEFAELAQKQIQALKAEADWEWTRQRGTIAAYQLFLKKHPDSEFVPDAVTQISDLIEQARIERDQKIENARRRQEQEAAELKEALIQKLRDEVKSDCETIDGFKTTVRLAKGLLLRELDKAGIKLEYKWLHSSYSTRIQGLIKRIDEAFPYFDKIIEATDGERVFSLRWSLDAPPAPLCRAVEYELRLGIFSENLLAAIKNYRKKFRENNACYFQIMAEIKDEEGFLGYLDECSHLD